MSNPAHKENCGIGPKSIYVLKHNCVDNMLLCLLSDFTALYLPLLSYEHFMCLLT